MATLSVLASMMLAPTALWGEDTTKAATTPAITIGPYLQNPAPNAMTVTFCIDTSDPLTVEYGPAEDKLDQKAQVKSISVQEAMLHQARIQGLKPGVSYFYRIVNSKTGDVLSPPTSFTTQNRQADHVTGVIFNDLHDNVPLLKTFKPQWQKINFDFMLFNGDCWEDPKKIRSLGTLTGVTRACPVATTPMIFLRGNHEYRGPWHDTLMDFFDVPQRAENKFYFAFTQGPVRFVCLDCCEDDRKGEEQFRPYRAEELKWIKQEVASKSFREAKYRVLIMHLALYGSESTDSSQPCHEMWSSVLDKANINLCIAAHVHEARLHMPNDPGVFKAKANSHANPYPVLVGGGPSLKGKNAGTMTILEADATTLQARSFDAEGKLVHEFKKSAGAATGQ
jgi:hypothetical protein